MSVCKIVSYDLCNPGKDYKDLIDAIKQYSCTKLTESCWFIVSDDSAKNIRNNLQQYMDSNDRIYVGSLDHGNAWSNLIGDADFVKSNLDSIN